VHEAYLRLAGTEHPDYQNRCHFFGVAANIMRQILVDRARARDAGKRGGRAIKLPINEALDFSPKRAATVVALDEALLRLAEIDAGKSRMVELQFFGGMTADEIASHLSLSVHSVRHHLRMAMAWLHREVAGHAR
jgi:RNA polymerase sigma factor (TIGR02999 family)